jgi:hypothetical protein
MRRRNLAILMALFCALFASAQTTQFTGTIRDSTNTPVASGVVNFTAPAWRGHDYFRRRTVHGRHGDVFDRESGDQLDLARGERGHRDHQLSSRLLYRRPGQHTGVTDATYNANGFTILLRRRDAFTYAQTAANGSSSGAMPAISSGSAERALAL